MTHHWFKFKTPVLEGMLYKPVGVNLLFAGCFERNSFIVRACPAGEGVSPVIGMRFFGGFMTCLALLIHKHTHT